MPGKKMRRIGILTAGGDCPGLNAVIRAVAKKSQNDHGVEVVGIEDGYIGLAQGRGHVLTNRDVSGILATGGTILGTERGNPFKAGGKKDGDYSGFKKAFKSLGLDALVCVGGEGTLTFANMLYQNGFPTVGVPKTIDNDVMETDVTFGFNSAVSILMQAIDNLHTTAMSHHRVIVVEVMGRHVGWLALAAGVAGGGDILILPEIPYDEDVVYERVIERSREGKRFSIVVVAEGVKASGRLVGEMEKGRIRLGGISWILSEQIEQVTKLETRPVVMGHLQRGGAPSAYDRLLATELASKAVDLVMEGKFGEMSAVRGISIGSVAMARAVRKLKMVPRNHPLIRTAISVGTSFGVREL